MIGAYRSWLLWRAHRLRLRADRAAKDAAETVMEWRRRADEYEAEAARLAREQAAKRDF